MPCRTLHRDGPSPGTCRSLSRPNSAICPRDAAKVGSNSAGHLKPLRHGKGGSLQDTDATTTAVAHASCRRRNNLERAWRALHLAKCDAVGVRKLLRCEKIPRARQVTRRRCWFLAVCICVQIDGYVDPDDSFVAKGTDWCGRTAALWCRRTTCCRRGAVRVEGCLVPLLGGNYRAPRRGSGCSCRVDRSVGKDRGEPKRGHFCKADGGAGHLSFARADLLRVEVGHHLFLPIGARALKQARVRSTQRRSRAGRQRSPRVPAM